MRRTTASRWALSGALALSCIAAARALAQPPGRLPRDLPRWTLSASPVLQLGTEGDSTTEFLRIAAVTRMPSGEIVVANGGTFELRVFSATGGFLRSLSRRGQGPGEVTNIMRVFRAGDTLVVGEFSPAATRLHIFTLADGFRTRFQVRPPGASSGAGVLARLSTGQYMIVLGGFFVPQPVADLITRDTMRIGIMDPLAQREVTWIGTFHNHYWLGYRSPSLRSGVGFTRFTLGASLAYAASGDRVWIGDPDSGSITMYDSAGRRVATAIMPLRPRAFSGPALERAKQRLLASATTPDARTRYENIYDNGRRPRTAPMFSRFIPATDGQMAVELFEEEGVAVPQTLIIFDRTGKAVGGLVVPAHVVLHEIGSDYALGVHTDEDGVETVVQYRLQR